MNNRRRTKIREAVLLINNSVNILSQIKDEEQDCLDNFPENLQNSERYTGMEDSINILEDSISDLEQRADDLGSL